MTVITTHSIIIGNISLQLLWLKQNIAWCPLLTLGKGVLSYPQWVEILKAGFSSLTLKRNAAPVKSVEYFLPEVLMIYHMLVFGLNSRLP